jgi:hypothetical protein
MAEAMLRRPRIRPGDKAVRDPRRKLARPTRRACGSQPRTVRHTDPHGPVFMVVPEQQVAPVVPRQVPVVVIRRGASVPAYEKMIAVPVVLFAMTNTCCPQGSVYCIHSSTSKGRSTESPPRLNPSKVLEYCQARFCRSGRTTEVIALASRPSVGPVFEGCVELTPPPALGVVLRFDELRPPFAEGESGRPAEPPQSAHETQNADTENSKTRRPPTIVLLETLSLMPHQIDHPFIRLVELYQYIEELCAGKRGLSRPVSHGCLRCPPR